jgi:HD-GYP domain-containing protein (c-di-GMP phosphodiesterase class II)
VVILPEDASSVKLALNLADQRMYVAKGKAERAPHSQTQSVLMQLLTEREPALHSHLCGVGALAVGIGRRFRLDSEQLDELRRAAELHDLGKLAIPDELLHKSGPLSEAERDFMRQHTIIGERILAVAPSLRVIARLVRSSHERWEGKGYPDGLAGEAIPLGARIIAACDAYDAIVSDRGYRAPRSVGEAVVELRRHAGSQFDPRVVEALCEHLQALPTAGARAHYQSHPRRAAEVHGSRSTA